MASFVLLIKEFEDDDRVVYKFGPNDNMMIICKVIQIMIDYSRRYM